MQKLFNGHNMNLRRYEIKDDNELKEMLLNEDMKENEMIYKDNNVDTFILDDNGIVKGFFSIKSEYGFPSLQHLCIGKQYRTPALAREIGKYFKWIIKVNGFKKAIIHSKEDYLRKITEYYYKVKPYAIKDNRAWYIVDI